MVGCFSNMCLCDFGTFFLASTSSCSFPAIWHCPGIPCSAICLYRVRQKTLTIFKLQQDEKYTIFLYEFINKIIFISKHFNYSIHFLNTVSVRWRPLLSARSRKRRTSDKSLTQSFDAPNSSKWRLSSCTFSFCGRRCISAVSHPQQYSIETKDTVIPMNIEVPTKYRLSHNDRTVVLEIRLHSESPMLYRPALHGNWDALSLARRALKDNFPHANDSTHGCIAKSSVISAGNCILP